MPNAVQMIRQDHKKVKGLFRKFDQAKNNGAKKRIADQVIQELKTLDSEDDQLEEQFAELVECIKHHVEEEESEMLPKAEESSMDLTDYGKQMSERKAELTGKTQTKSSKSKAGRKAKAKSKRRRSRRAA